MASSKLIQSFRYRFDRFMARGGVSIFLSLLIAFIVIFIVLAVLRGILVALFPPEEMAVQNELDFWGNAYITFLELTAPSNMNKDLASSPLYKILAIAAGFSGVIIFSALIAFITTGLNQKLAQLKRGHSKVIEEAHTLILGWNEQRIIEIIRELIFANESEQTGVIVILADEDKEKMDDTVRLRIPNSRNTRIVTRSGNVSSLANLQVVSVETCGSVIILAGCTESSPENQKATSDAKVIQSILAITSVTKERSDISIVAEIFNETHREIVKNAFPESVVALDTDDILAKILVQTSRSVGLSVVYNEILSFDGSEIYFYGAKWGQIRFGELAYHFPDGIPLGVRQKDRSLLLNPSVDYEMRSEDEVLILAQDDSTIEFQSQPVAIPRSLELAGGRNNKKVEKELILGWTNKAATILREYADYVQKGSRIDIMLKTPSEEVIEQINVLRDELQELEIHLLWKDKLSIEDLLAVEPFTYDNIVILAEGDGEPDIQKIDSENIVTLLLLRDIFRRFPEKSKGTRLITEVLDSQNYLLISEAGVKDVIISSRLISMILAQVSEARDIKLVYDDIFDEKGSEIYIKPASLYFKNLPFEVNYADMIAITQKRKEVCLGVKISKYESDITRNFGITLIPEKGKPYMLTAEDALVVLSQDES